MASRLRVAFVSVGLHGHGHNVSFAPNAIVTVAAAAWRELGGEVEGKVFDEVLLGHAKLLEELEAFDPQALLVGVPVTGYYPSAVRLARWAEGRGVPVLMGGYHFSIPGSGAGIPRLAAERRGFAVCYGDGEASATGFLRHVLRPGRPGLSKVPNLYYKDGDAVVKTQPSETPPGSAPYPALPLSWHDPRPYWRLLEGSHVQRSGRDAVDGVPVGRTLVGPKVVTGCTYRSARHKAGKEACGYCTLTSAYARASGQRFWELTREMYDYVESVPWDGDSGVRCYQIGDDMGSDLSLVREIWERRPSWKGDLPLGHRVYAWQVLGEDLARMLYEVGVRWVYVGADGKEGFTPDWSGRHPLVRTLENCRRHGLSASVGFVLGRRDQTWEDVGRWQAFCRRLTREFGDVLIITDGWVNVVAPGSPDWELLCGIDTSFADTDCPDLEAARETFFRRCTRLCAGGLTPTQVRERLYALAAEFENDRESHPVAVRSFMLEP